MNENIWTKTIYSCIWSWIYMWFNAGSTKTKHIYAVWKRSPLFVQEVKWLSLRYSIKLIFIIFWYLCMYIVNWFGYFWQEYVHGNQLSGSIVNKMIKFVLSVGISLLTTSRGIYRLSWVTSLILVRCKFMITCI